MYTQIHATTKGGFRGFALVATLSLMILLTNLNVGVEMDKTKLGLKPGETKILNAPTLSGSTNVPIRYSFYHPKEQEWKMLSASTVVLHQTRREICIFSWDPRFNRVDYHGITFPVDRDVDS